MNKKFSNEYFDNLEKWVYSAVVSDILDSMGYRNQSVDPRIRPLIPDRVLVGRAKTVQVSEVNREPDKPYEKLIEMMDSIQEGEVIVAALGGSTRSGFFGELLGTAASCLGGRGAVVDGAIRDTRQLKEMDFPVYCVGFRPTDSFGRNEVIEYDCTIDCGGVSVNNGDLIVADMDGIVIVPKEIENEVIEKALEKVSTENIVRKKLINGTKLSEVFEQEGVL